MDSFNQNLVLLIKKGKIRMAQPDSFIISFSKILAFKVRLLLRFRYKISIKGSDILQNHSPILFLPNHQALIDPVILLSQIYRFTSVTPVISEKYFDVPIAKWYFQQLGAIRVSDLETGNRDTQVLQSIISSVYKGLGSNNNIVIYPSGQIAGQGYEKIFNKKSAYHIVNSIPENVQIVGVRFTGLWGSMFSKAKSGKSPNFLVKILTGIFYVLANLLFFTPKRSVSLEFENITALAKEKVLLGQKAFNLFLEDFYNRHGEEPALFLKHIFYLPQTNRKTILNQPLKPKDPDSDSTIA
jgi:long-chain-fatty-acid--[acyl-carrier-protein] ligase